MQLSNIINILYKTKKYNILKVIFVSISIFFIQACGYRTVEKDKYPDMPIFPETTNKNYSLDSLTTMDLGVKYTDKYMFLITKKEPNDSLEQVTLCIYDKYMNRVKEIHASPLFDKDKIVYNVDSDNNIYIIGIDNKLYKYTYPWNKAIEMHKILDVTQRDSMKLVYANEITKRIAQDSLFYEEGFINNIFNTKIKELYDINDCVLPIDPYHYEYFVVLNNSMGQQSYAIIRDYSELWESSFQNRKFMCDSLVHNYTYLNEHDAPNLKLEQATLGNKSSGNHFVFGYTAYGYDYYKINIDKDTISFKIENGSLSNPRFSQFGSAFTNQVLLLHDDILYRVRKNE